MIVMRSTSQPQDSFLNFSFPLLPMTQMLCVETPVISLFCLLSLAQSDFSFP